MIDSVRQRFWGNLAAAAQSRFERGQLDAQLSEMLLYAQGRSRTFGANGAETRPGRPQRRAGAMASWAGSIGAWAVAAETVSGSRPPAETSERPCACRLGLNDHPTDLRRRHSIRSSQGNSLLDRPDARANESLLDRHGGSGHGRRSR